MAGTLPWLGTRNLAAPRRAPPRRAAPRHATPRHAVPRHGTPSHAMRNRAQPCHANWRLAHGGWRGLARTGGC
eukprot:6539068-Lingulodinium_polyedra.AAC.1